jgi:hypothetical protein
MTLCIRKLETIQGIYYGLTFYNGYFRAGVTLELPPGYIEIVINDRDDNFNAIVLRMSVLQGKDPNDSTVWYWLPEDVVKQMAIMWESYENISKTTARFLKRLLGVNETSPMMPELLEGVAENKENLKDHPMEQHMCLALAMAAHPTLGSESHLSKLFETGVIAKVVPGLHSNPKFNWSKRPAPAPQDDRARRQYDYYIKQGDTF